MRAQNSHSERATKAQRKLKLRAAYILGKVRKSHKFRNYPLGYLNPSKSRVAVVHYSSKPISYENNFLKRKLRVNKSSWKPSNVLKATSELQDNSGTIMLAARFDNYPIAQRKFNGPTIYEVTGAFGNLRTGNDRTSSKLSFTLYTPTEELNKITKIIIHVEDFQKFMFYQPLFTQIQIKKSFFIDQLAQAYERNILPPQATTSGKRLQNFELCLTNSFNGHFGYEDLKVLSRRFSVGSLVLWKTGPYNYSLSFMESPDFVVSVSLAQNGKCLFSEIAFDTWHNKRIMARHLNDRTQMEMYKEILFRIFRNMARDLSKVYDLAYGIEGEEIKNMIDETSEKDALLDVYTELMIFYSFENDNLHIQDQMKENEIEILTSKSTAEINIALNELSSLKTLAQDMKKDLQEFQQHNAELVLQQRKNQDEHKERIWNLCKEILIQKNFLKQNEQDLRREVLRMQQEVNALATNCHDFELIMLMEINQTARNIQKLRAEANNNLESRIWMRLMSTGTLNVILTVCTLIAHQFY